MDEDGKIVMTVDIGDGEIGTISISAKDSPDELAKAFAFKHGLEKDLQRSLARLIKQNKDIMANRSPSSLSINSHYGKIDEQHAEEEESSSPNITEKEIFNMKKADQEVFKRLYSERKAVSRDSMTRTTPRTVSIASTISPNHGATLYNIGKTIQSST